MTVAALEAWWSKLDFGRTALLCLAILVAFLLLGWILRRFRAPKIVKLPEEGGCGICRKVRDRLFRLFSAFDYLTTRREWRYKQPWMLVVGERGSGKSSLLASVPPALQHAQPSRAAELKAEGMAWRYYRDGALIDADGTLSTAADGTPEAKRWAKGLEELDALRPERPLDGIVLLVSAAALRLTGRNSRAALAAEAARQLDRLQTSIEYMLPVYVVVTRCDEIPGFSAFWRNLGEARFGDMFGYSAEANDQSLEPQQWADVACDRIGARLRELQVAVAARRADLDDPDEFFLFPGHFRALREPLGQWLETVFKASAWQSGHLFRGLYFIGAVEAAGERTEGVRSDVDFVGSLMGDKILKEVALARPTRKGLWSRNELIRRVQYTGIFLAIALLASLGVATLQISRQLDASVAAVRKLIQLSPRVPDAGSNECLAAGDVYPLLEKIGGIETDLRRLAIPASWLDYRMSQRTAGVIGKETIDKVLMPTLSCRLEQRARDLISGAQNIEHDRRGPLKDQSARLRALVAGAREFEDNLKRYRTLAHDADTLDERGALDTLDALARYTLDQPLPRAARRKNGVLDDAFRQTLDVPMPVLPENMHQRIASAIGTRTEYVRNAITVEVASGNDLIVSLGRGEQPILQNTRRLGEWMTWIQGQWLASSEDRNPCQAVVDANKSDIDALIQSYGEIAGLAGVLGKFDEKHCHAVELQAIADMKLSPYGNMFVPDPEASKSGAVSLMLVPELAHELDGLPALVSLPFMQLRSASPFACVGSAVSWHAQEVAEAAGYLQQYRAFAKEHPQPTLPDGGAPLYDRLARYSLSIALDDALRRAQQAPPGGRYAADAATPSDTVLAATGGELSRAMDSLLTVVNAYDDLGFPDDGAAVRQCARNFAADHLGSVDALAEVSRLYAPQVAASGDDIYTFGNVPVTRDFLQRQVGRVQVLGSYAQPFLTLLEGTGSVDDAWRDAPQTAVYWRNTLDELARYTKGKEPAGQVANLDAYFINQLTGMTYENCGSVLAAYRSPETGDDLFSSRRSSLEAQVRLRCTDRRSADAAQLYADLASRFNRDLAGRYPFGGIDARDASATSVRAFFLEYAARRQAIATAVNGLDGASWRTADAFLADLDTVSAFFSMNVSAPEDMAAIGVSAGFPADTGRSAGADQIVRWRLSIDLLESVFPNGRADLPWYPNEPVGFELQWADRSTWRPVADPTQPSLRVTGNAASFGETGDWALLRFIERHRVPGSGAGDAPIVLRFVLPTIAVATPAKGEKPAQPPATADAIVFANLRLTGTDVAKGTEKTLALPVRFPRTAPALE